MNWKYTDPPTDRKILAYIDFCGRKSINVIKWSKTNETYITDMQLNWINHPICWMELPNEPNGV